MYSALPGAIKLGFFNWLEPTRHVRVSSLVPPDFQGRLTFPCTPEGGQ